MTCAVAAAASQQPCDAKDGTFHLYIFFSAMGEIRIALDSVRANPPSPPPLPEIYFMEQKRGKECEISMGSGTTHSERKRRERERGR